MNTRRKGQRTELKAVQQLKKDGWITYQVKGSLIFNKNVDIFGLFDIFALKKITQENSPLFTIKRRFIQVKTNRKPDLNPFRHFKKNYGDGLTLIEIWIWKDRKGFEIISI
ncbi:MAG: hypothetical protein AABY22_32745 [Nanoarchaeota archaeon]